MNVHPIPLSLQQQALLAALFRPDHGLDTQLQAAGLRTSDQARRGLLAYRANGHALAERALAGAYPVLSALIGPDSFAALARALWHAHPPVRGDLAHWGAELPHFVQASESLDQAPYLGDVARTEWALHQAAGAADAWADLPSLALLTQDDPATLGLRLAPGTALITSHYPVVSIVQAHLSQDIDLDEAGRRWRAGVAETALVWRAGLRPQVRQVHSTTEAALLRALLASASLLEALETACTDPDPGAFDLSAWLMSVVSEGLVLGATTLPTTTESPS